MLPGCHAIPGDSLLSVRVIIGSYWLFTVTVCAIYQGNLVASLAVRTINSPVASLRDVAAQDDYKLMFWANTARQELFQVR